MKKLILTITMVSLITSGYGQAVVSDPGAMAQRTANTAQITMALQQLNMSVTKSQMQQLQSSGESIGWLNKLFQNNEELKNIFDKGVEVLRDGAMIARIAQKLDRAIGAITRLSIDLELSTDNSVFKYFWLRTLSEQVERDVEQAKDLAKEAVSTSNKMTMGDRLILANKALDRANSALLTAEYIERVRGVYFNYYERLSRDRRTVESLTNSYREKKRTKIKESGAFLTGQ